MAKKVEPTPAVKTANNDRVNKVISEVLGSPRRLISVLHHVQPAHFKRDRSIEITIFFDKLPKTALLYYRHTNQRERYQSMDMKAEGKSYKAQITTEYTDSPYALEYYFELRETPEAAWLYPGFNEKLDNQPYIIIRQA